MWDFFTTVLLVVKIFWFLGLTLKLYPYFPFSWISEPTKFWKNTLVIYLDFVFVVNLLIHNLILYSVFKVHSWILKIQWWAWEDSNLRPHAYQACALTTWATSPYACLFTNLLRYCSFSAVLTYISMFRSSKLACLVSSQKSCAFFAHAFLKIHSAET